MVDYEHQELVNKIRSLERKIDDLEHELRQDKTNLQAQIWRKADKEHTHES